MADDIKVLGYHQWVDLGAGDHLEIGHAACTVEGLQEALGDIPGVEVVSVTRNASGTFDAGADPALLTMPGFPAVYEGLPDYYDVRLAHTTGRHVEGIVIWLPVSWNRRYLGLGGGGFRSDAFWGMELPGMRSCSVPMGLKNGFVSSSTNGGVADIANIDWVLDLETNEFDSELADNFTHASIHFMAVVSKRVIEVLYGCGPEYSYFQGTSTGGRQAMMEAQRHPEDFDGVWSDCPAMNWTRFVLAEIWPHLLMRTSGNVLPAAKLEAFRQAVFEACGGVQNYFNRIERVDLDAMTVVGTDTDAGLITEDDARLMQEIWDGPRDAEGNQLWFGIRPGAESWAAPGFLLASENGQIMPFVIPLIYIGSWLLKQRGWDWTTLTREQLVELFVQSVSEFAELATDDPDLSGLRASGGKLLVTHGLDDEVIFPDGTISYYERVIDAMGDKGVVDTFVRLFLFPGNGHSLIKFAPGFTMADGMAALMRWVEQDIVPDEVEGRFINPMTGESSQETIFRSC